MGKWIKIEERLPKENTWVLCFLPRIGFEFNVIIGLKFYYHEYFIEGKLEKMPMFSMIDRSWYISDITHWMPLPAKPEEEADGRED